MANLNHNDILYGNYNSHETYAYLVSLKLYSGSYGEYVDLPPDKKAELIAQMESIKEKYNIDSNIGVFKGTIAEYAALTEGEQLEIRIKRLAWKKKAIIDTIESFARELKGADAKQFSDIRNIYYSRLKPTIYDYQASLPLDALSQAAEKGIQIPSDIHSLVSPKIERPKFGLMDNKRYKILNDLITDEYIFRLKTRQIDSDFTSEQDYGSKQKWKEFLDRKATEYKSLINNGQYDGSFEAYLQEDIITTTGLLRFNKSKKSPSHDLADSIRFSNKVSEVSANANREMAGVMRGPAAQSLMQHTVNDLKNIIGEDTMRDIEQRYRNGEFDDDHDQPKRM